ncbi:ClbS/DfsB family four-helix bundle protein [Enterococcus raffinosus]|uniref:ClbS/DfsB family four-helix bundle protein n=1 Tax=Enterococcus raffinosus TaxID=71452 RepID=UPI001C12720E|nr:ClbS/DfsB family four-helix bundle protein [Enterococcus raffinosus]MBU5359631.1 ClbS/DfsB family four-helix bundle protein [Enterococcus raffinosus]
MQEYTSKEAFIAEIEKRAELFIKEYADIKEEDKDVRFDEAERTPYEILAYQLGWLALIQDWEETESAGQTVAMPAPGIKWNQMGPLHEQFYADYQGKSLAELIQLFRQAVEKNNQWLASLDDDVLFKPGGRKWAQSTASNWPVWKWVHINTVAPFKSFRTKVRKWKKLRTA